MAKQKLNYRFHNPNSVESTADHLLKIFIEANAKKVETAIKEASENSSSLDKKYITYDNHSA